MIYKKIFVSLILCLLFFSNFTVVSAEEVDKIDILKNYLVSQQNLEQFSALINLEVDFSPTQKSKFSFNYYFKRPDKIYIDTDDFILLPSDTLDTLKPDFFAPEKYHIKFLEEKYEDDIIVYNYLLQPKENDSFEINLNFKPEKEFLSKAQLNISLLDYENTLTVNIYYDIINGFSLPVLIEGDVPLPYRFGSEGQIEKMAGTSFELYITDYKIMETFPENIIEKLQ